MKSTGRRPRAIIGIKVSNVKNDCFQTKQDKLHLTILGFDKSCYATGRSCAMIGEIFTGFHRYVIPTDEMHTDSPTPPRWYDPVEIDGLYDKTMQGCRAGKPGPVFRIYSQFGCVIAPPNLKVQDINNLSFHT